MVLELLIPGMQDGDDAHRCAKTPLAKLKQRFTDGSKEQA